MIILMSLMNKYDLYLNLLLLSLVHICVKNIIKLMANDNKTVPGKFHPRKFHPRKFHPRKFHPRKFHPAKIPPT